MVKCIAPLGSLSASGKLGPIIYETGMFGQYAKMHTPQKGKPSLLQLEQNYKFGVASDKWRALSPEEQAYWETMSKGTKMTGYNLFIKENINRSSHVGESVIGVDVIG